MLHAEQLAGEEDAIAARKRLVQAVFSWQESSQAANAASVNVICDIIQGSSSELEGGWGAARAEAVGGGGPSQRLPSAASGGSTANLHCRQACSC